MTLEFEPSIKELVEEIRATQRAIAMSQRRLAILEYKVDHLLEQYRKARVGGEVAYDFD